MTLYSNSSDAKSHQLYAFLDTNAIVRCSAFFMYWLRTQRGLFFVEGLYN